MTDLTLLYYTANRIGDHFAHEVLMALLSGALEVTENPFDYHYYPIVSVSHKPIDVGRNICVGEKPPSIWQVYQNILLGAKAAKTPFIACCEDDTLYAPSHFSYRPALDTFAYDLSRWVITRDLAPDGKSRIAKFYWRERHQMAMCIAPRDLLVETLEERFAKYPEPVEHETAKKTGWGEPGRYEKNLGLTRRKMEYFRAAGPSVTFNHSESLMGRRRVNPTDIICQDLPPWGNATELWRRIHG